MPLNTQTTALIKVTMPKPTKVALGMIAEQEGVSLSDLLLNAAVDKHLVGKHRVKAKKEEPDSER